MSTSSLILQSFLNTSNVEDTNELRIRSKNLLEYNKKTKGGGFLTPLDYYLEILNASPKCIIHLSNEEQKRTLLRDLQIAYLLLLSQQQYELDYQKYENQKKYDNDLQKCKELIDFIQDELNSKHEDIPKIESSASDSPICYLFIQYAYHFSKTLVGLADRKTKTIREAMTWFNDKRLYWVWGSSLLKMVLDVIPPDFFNASQAAGAVKAPDPYTGTISWALYYFRFSLNLFLLLKHTIRGPWMSEEEKQVPWTERFKTQWDQRKFTLLNDSIWATANLLCFFWLNSRYGLGAWGDLLTLALLLFDVSMTIWDFAEQSTKYNKEMLDYEKDINELKVTIEAQKSKIDEEQEPKAKQALIQALKENELKLSGLRKAQEKCKREWGYTKISLATGLAYAVGLMLAFALLTLPFLPISGPAVTAITLTGAVLCFAFTVINNAIKSGMEIYKAAVSKQEAQEEFETKLSLFRENPPILERDKQLLFLEIKKAKAETDHQKDMIVYQIMHFLRSVFIEACTPALVFASFVFFPLGIGIAVLGSALGVAVGSNLLIEKLFKPETQEALEFDQNEYEQFCRDINTVELKAAPNCSGFFSAKRNEDTKEDLFDDSSLALE